MITEPRRWTAALSALALFWVIGGSAPLRAQAGGETSVPRIPLQPVRPDPSAPAVPADPASGELLPALPPDPRRDPPRKVPAAAVMPLPPDVPPLGLPSDGEAAPSFPDLPDLPESSLLPQLPSDEQGFVPGQPTPDPAADPPGGTPPVPNDPNSPGPPAAAEPASPFPVWHESPKKARSLAQQDKRCFLLFFSSSQGEAGGTSRQMNDEVFASPEFNQFALDHLVLSVLFYARSSALDLNDPTKIGRLDAMTAIKKAFKVRGFPCVIVFGPDGQEINRWTGYVSGRGQYYQQQIKQAVEGHEQVLFATERRRAHLAAKGYRTWTSTQGSPLFARLVRFDARTAVFLDEGGAERTVSLKQLTLPDREIITRQRLGRPMPERAPTPERGRETTLR